MYKKCASWSDSPLTPAPVASGPPEKSKSSLFLSLPEYELKMLENKISALKVKEGFWKQKQASVARQSVNERIELSRCAKKFQPYLKKPRINKKCLDFLEAIEKGNFDRVKRIFTEESTLNLETRRGDEKWTPLIMAVYFGHLDIVKFLINCGADVEVEDANGISPLTHATLNKNRNENPHLIIRAITEAAAYRKKKVKTVCLL